MLLCALPSAAEAAPWDGEEEREAPDTASEEEDAPDDDADEVEDGEAPLGVPTGDLGTVEPIDRHRVRLDKLMEQTIGYSAKPVVYEWRDSRAMFSVQASQLVELNTFNTVRLGGQVRLPREPVIVELSLGYAHSWDSAASRQLALTPYRQPGRPSRIYGELGLALPLAEGVVTARPRWFPPVHMVFEGYAGLRYGFYPFSFDEMRLREVVGAVLSPGLTGQELDNLDARRLDAMQIDQGRYFTMVGLGNVFYLGSGLYVAPRVQVGLPLMAPASQTELLFWGDVSVSVGWAL